MEMQVGAGAWKGLLAAAEEMGFVLCWRRGDTSTELMLFFVLQLSLGWVYLQLCVPACWNILSNNL